MHLRTTLLVVDFVPVAWTSVLASGVWADPVRVFPAMLGLGGPGPLQPCVHLIAFLHLPREHVSAPFLPSDFLLRRQLQCTAQGRDAHSHTCHSITATHPQGSSHLLGYHYDIKCTDF